jgi:hypothetical protein
MDQYIAEFLAERTSNMGKSQASSSSYSLRAYPYFPPSPPISRPSPPAYYVPLSPPIYRSSYSVPFPHPCPPVPEPSSALLRLIYGVVNQQPVEVSQIYEEKFDFSDEEDFAPPQPLGEDESEFDEFDEFFEPEEDCRHLGGHEHKLSAFHVSSAELATLHRPTPSPDIILPFSPIDDEDNSSSEFFTPPSSPSTRILQSSLEEISSLRLSSLSIPVAEMVPVQFERAFTPEEYLSVIPIRSEDDYPVYTPNMIEKSMNTHVIPSSPCPSPPSSPDYSCYYCCEFCGGSCV